jgi:dTDP-4-amino-4,6-dideoxygalactose transaminase
MIPVTKPFLAPLAEYHDFLEAIWKRNWLTNNGPFVNELELRLKDYLDLKHLLYLSNGTVALQIAIKAMGLKGEIITTPFSYVATTGSIVWEGCKPVFVDIDPETYNIDPFKIEEAISSNTSAILATHCFGNPCDVDTIANIASKHQLKVIYDAAHCFGTKYRGRSIFHYGDISATSFHATKIFHTVEGGAVFTKDPALLKKMAYLRNFGHDGPEKFSGVGINGKNSELHAAMGLLNLRYLDQILEKRMEQTNYYHEILKGLECKFQKITYQEGFNYAYFPILLRDEMLMMKMKLELERNFIFPRRYFYPSLSNLDYVTGDTPIADDIASRILCLPLYHDLTNEEQAMIARILLRVQNY